MNKIGLIYKKILKILRIFIFIFLSLFIIEMGLRITGEAYISGAYSHNINYPNNSINILTIGESSTSGLYVNYSDSYPAQLQNLLGQAYPNDSINVIVPLFMGQDTGEVSNRVKQDILEYHPKIMILMIGYDNTFSFAESNIGKFMNGSDKLKAELSVFFDNFKTFRVVRYAYLSIINSQKDKDYIQRLKDQSYMWGGPELAQYPPPQWLYSFSRNPDNQQAFVNLWNYDVKNIIDTAKKHNVTVILMTYHINPTYLSPEDFENMSKMENISLVRNDLTFQKFIENKTINDYILPVDYWHPNAKGYSIIANNVFQDIVENHLIK